MSGICQRTDRRDRRGGFTLLELLVVLAVLGTATALVGPAALASIGRWQDRAALDAVLDQIRALPGRARAAGHAIEMGQPAAGEALPVDLPEGWSLQVADPWTVQANGACPSARFAVDTGRELREFRVLAPFCEPALVDE